MDILDIKYIDVYAVFTILIVFGFIETLGGLYGKKSIRSKNDWHVELLSTFHLFILIKPTIFFSTTFPAFHNVLKIRLAVDRRT